MAHKESSEVNRKKVDRDERQRAYEAQLTEEYGGFEPVLQMRSQFAQLNSEEKDADVLRLLNDGKTHREIRFTSGVGGYMLSRLAKQKSDATDNRTSKSKSTRKPKRKKRKTFDEDSDDAGTQQPDDDEYVGRESDNSEDFDLFQSSDDQDSTTTRKQANNQKATPSQQNANGKKAVFAGVAIACFGALSQSKAVLKNAIVEHGGIFLTKATDPKLSIVITTERRATDPKKAPQEAQAAAKGIPLVREAFLWDSIASGERKDVKDYSFSLPEATESRRPIRRTRMLHTDMDVDSDSPTNHAVIRNSDTDTDAEWSRASTPIDRKDTSFLQAIDPYRILSSQNSEPHRELITDLKRCFGFSVHLVSGTSFFTLTSFKPRVYDLIFEVETSERLVFDEADDNVENAALTIASLATSPIFIYRIYCSRFLVSLRSDFFRSLIVASEKTYGKRGNPIGTTNDVDNNATIVRLQDIEPSVACCMLSYLSFSEMIVLPAHSLPKRYNNALFSEAAPLQQEAFTVMLAARGYSKTHDIDLVYEYIHPLISTRISKIEAAIQKYQLHCSTQDFQLLQSTISEESVAIIFETVASICEGLTYISAFHVSDGNDDNKIDSQRLTQAVYPAIGSLLQHQLSNVNLFSAKLNRDSSKLSTLSTIEKSAVALFKALSLQHMIDLISESEHEWFSNVNEMTIILKAIDWAVCHVNSTDLGQIRDHIAELLPHVLFEYIAEDEISVLERTGLFTSAEIQAIRNTSATKHSPIRTAGSAEKTLEPSKTQQITLFGVSITTPRMTRAQRKIYNAELNKFASTETQRQVAEGAAQPNSSANSEINYALEERTTISTRTRRQSRASNNKSTSADVSHTSSAQQQLTKTANAKHQPQTQTQSPQAKLTIPMKKIDLRYTIQSEKLRERERIFLPIFSACDTRWCISAQVSQGFLNIFVYNMDIVEGNSLPNPITTGVCLRLVNSNDSALSKCSRFAKTWKDVKAWGYSKVVTLEQLSDPNNGWLHVAQPSSSESEITNAESSRRFIVIEAGMELVDRAVVTRVP